MTPPVVEARSLSRSYPGGIEALRDVDLTVEEGEFVAVVGRSGSGKSTLLNIIGGLDAPTAGSVSIRGRLLDYTDRRALVAHRRSMVGFVFQQFNLIPTLTAQENVEFPLIFSGVPPGERRRKAGELLAVVGLSGRASHYPDHLSGGEQQRVAIARALVSGAPLLLADEPTGNLDSSTSEEIFALLRRVNLEEGISVILVTHEREFLSYADRGVELRDGRMVA